jgi:hypothetical protein
MLREKGKKIPSEKIATAKTAVILFTLIPQVSGFSILLASLFIYF